MVSASVARRLWPGQSAVGRRLVIDYSTAGTYPYDVVGVVDDIRFRGPRGQASFEIYLPHAQRPYLVMNVVVKAAGDPRAQANVDRRLTEFATPEGMLFRVKVTSTGDRAGVLLAEADRIRDELKSEGILLEDGAEGTTWRRA